MSGLHPPSGGETVGAATHGLWEETAPRAQVAPRLQGEVRADVAIVGAGYTGCSAALHLAEAGKHAVVLDAGEAGFGAAGRNVGLVNAGMWTMPDHAAEVLGPERGERLLKQLSEAPALVFDLADGLEIACEVERSGTLHCAAGRSGYVELAERARQWRERGADVQLLDPAAAADLIGSDSFSGALLDRRAGTIQPLSYVRGLARAATALGARFHFGSEVTSIDAQRGSWKIGTSDGSVTARAVIVATDAYSTGPWSALRREQVMLPYFNFATAPQPKEVLSTILRQRQGCWDTRRILSSFRRDAAGRIIFGSVGSLRGTGSIIHRDWAKRSLQRLFPQIANPQFTHAWHGMIGMTADALPRLHRLERDIYSISGFNGRGIAPGTTFGRDLARLALGQEPDAFALPITDLRKAPLRATRTAIYDFGSQATHLASARI
ncbi:MAG: FAD-binding oxidoreductase [Sphingomonadales bacterium]|nr:MAG: FAD-binding oxidoreductase [Sphingomonadales bacterium]